MGAAWLSIHRNYHVVEMVEAEISLGRVQVTGRWKKEGAEWTGAAGFQVISSHDWGELGR